MRLPGPGPAAERSSRPWCRADFLAAALLLLGTLVSLRWLVHPWFDRTPDGSMYLITARSLIEGYGHTLYGAPFYLRPPGFSYLLVPLVERVGNDFGAVHTLIHLFGVVAVLLMFVFQRARLGTWLAFLVAVGLWLTPGFRILSNQVMSDVPGVALLLAGLVGERVARRHDSLAGDLALGLFIGLAATVRTVVVLLLPAIIVSRVLERWAAAPAAHGNADGGRRGWVAFGVRELLPVAVAVLLIQIPVGRATGPPPGAEPVDQTARFSYASGMWHRDEADPGSEKLGWPEILRTRVPERVPDLVASLGSHAVSDDLTPGRLLMGAAFLLSALWVFLKRRAPADIFVLGAATLLALYFGYKPRLALPLYVVVMPAVFETLRDLAARVAGPAAGGRVAAVAAVAWIALVADPRPGWEGVRTEHDRFAEACAELAAALPATGAVGTGVAWDYAAYLERPVFSIRHHARRIGNTPLATLEMIDRYQMRAVFVDPERPGDREIWEYLNATAPDGKRAGPFVVFSTGEIGR